MLRHHSLSGKHLKSTIRRSSARAKKTAIVEKANELLRDPENKRYANLIAGEAIPTSQNSTDVLNARGFLGPLLARCVSADDPGLKAK